MEKYILLSIFATLTQEELELTKDWEETPLAVVAIAQEYIERWVLCSDYKSLEDFLNTSTYDVVEILAAEAERAGFLAFTYRPSLEPNFKFPEFCRLPIFSPKREWAHGGFQVPRRLAGDVGMGNIFMIVIRRQQQTVLVAEYIYRERITDYGTVYSGYSF